MAEITVEDLFNRMPKAFIPEAAKDVNAVLQFNLTGPEGGDWIVRIGDGKCTVEKGIVENPTMTLMADAEDYKNVITGKLDPMAAFMQQKLRLKGNLNMALGLMKFFKLR